MVLVVVTLSPESHKSLYATPERNTTLETLSTSYRHIRLLESYYSCSDASFLLGGFRFRNIYLQLNAEDTSQKTSPSMYILLVLQLLGMSA